VIILGAMVNIQFVSRPRGEFYAQNPNSKHIAFDVSSYAPEPFSLLSPFTYFPHIKIPVPGMDDTFSHSVEGIWQGLKVINHNIDTGLFSSKPRKRSGEVEGHLYKRTLLDIEEARRKIYVPAYVFFIDKYAPAEALDYILWQQREGKKVYLYDIEENGDIRINLPLAHASVLAMHLNLKIFNQPILPRTDGEEHLFQILDDSDKSLEKKVEIVRSLLADSHLNQAFTYRCVEHPQSMDDFYLAEAIGGIK